MTTQRRTSARLTPARLMAVPLLVMALTVLAACGSDSGGSDSAKSDGSTTTAASSATPDLDGLSFVSDSVSGYTLVKGTQLLFTFTGKSLSVNAGCNTMNSGYTLKGGILKWTHAPAATMMACEQPIMEQDTWITGLLTAGMKAEVTSKTLTLTSGDVTIELKADQP